MLDLIKVNQFFNMTKNFIDKSQLISVITEIEKICLEFNIDLEGPISLLPGKIFSFRCNDIKSDIAFGIYRYGTIACIYNFEIVELSDTKFEAIFTSDTLNINVEINNIDRNELLKIVKFYDMDTITSSF